MLALDAHVRDHPYARSVSARRLALASLAGDQIARLRTKVDKFKSDLESTKLQALGQRYSA